MDELAPQETPLKPTEIPFWMSPYFMGGILVAALSFFGITLTVENVTEIFGALPQVVTGISGIVSIVYGTKRDRLTSPSFLPGPDTDRNMGTVYPYTPSQAPIYDYRSAPAMDMPFHNVQDSANSYQNPHTIPQG